MRAAVELDQTQEIFRLNALVGELETHQKVQAQRVDATAHRWKLKRDQVCVRCLLYTSPSPRDRQKSRMPSSA